ncbi:hypothetical protein GCM10022419_079630 [Nonomuraea rosea]|uniref:Methyltransferase type 11 domain-containing protein n=1 Tax=Nonomuraea rosea TaxID=638574 RepID=A0ABP6YKS6_9ACTN
MALSTGDSADPSNAGRYFDSGMEQFHHPRPVRTGPAPTPQRLRLMAGLSGRILEIGAGDGSCDAVVCSLVLCCATRAQETLGEVRRVLTPGGELRFYEHQRSGNPAVTLAESLVTPFWSRATGGCHPARDTVAAIRQAGFDVEIVDRFTFRHFNHVLGVARRP